MIGQYWTTGIALNWDGRSKWSAALKFYDDGFVQDASTEGDLRLRYSVVDIVTGVKTLLQDAERLRITFKTRYIYVPSDGSDPELVPPNWREVVAQVAAATGMVSRYEYEVRP